MKKSFARHSAVVLFISSICAGVGSAQTLKAVAWEGMPMPSGYTVWGSFTEILNAGYGQPTIADNGDIAFVAWTGLGGEEPQYNDLWKVDRTGELTWVYGSARPEGPVTAIRECKNGMVSRNGTFQLAATLIDGTEGLLYRSPSEVEWSGVLNCYEAHLLLQDSTPLLNMNPYSPYCTPFDGMNYWWGFTCCAFSTINLPENTHIEHIWGNWWRTNSFGRDYEFEVESAYLPANIRRDSGTNGEDFDALLKWGDWIFPDPNSVNVEFSSGQLVPGNPSFRFAYVNQHICTFGWTGVGSGAHAFTAWIDGDPDRQSLWKVRVYPDHDPELVAITGGAVPGMPAGTTFGNNFAASSDTYPVMSRTTDLAFMASMNPGEPNGPFVGIFRYRSDDSTNDLFPIAWNGQVVEMLTSSGTKRMKFDSYLDGGLAMSERGDILFKADVAEVDESGVPIEPPHTAIVLFRDSPWSGGAGLPHFRLVAKVGDTIDLPGTGQATLDSLQFVYGSGSSDGRRRCINDGGDVVLWFSGYSEGSYLQGIAEWKGGCSDCPADFNCSGGPADDADMSAFFEAYNAGDERADVNHSGGTPDDADVAYFYTHWLEGC